MSADEAKPAEPRPGWADWLETASVPVLDLGYLPGGADAAARRASDFLHVHNRPEGFIVDCAGDGLSLRQRMLAQGYESFAEPHDPPGTRLYFRVAQACDPAAGAAADVSPVHPVLGAGGELYMDLRGMDPPGPMVSILTAIDGGEAGRSMVASLDRYPVWLFPELEERGWTWQDLAGEAGEVRLRFMAPAAGAP